MKTKEFVKIMKDAGFEVKVGNFGIRVLQVDDSAIWTLAWVSQVKRFNLNTRYDRFNALGFATRSFIAEEVFKYASTPIAERGEEVTNAE